MNEAWGKLLIYFFAVLCTAFIVCYSTYENLPESFWIVTGLLAISCGITGVFLYCSGKATKKIVRYCVIAAVIIGTSDCLGLIVHVVLTRELAIAKADIADKERTEDREDKRRKERTKEELARINAQKELLKEQKAALKQDAIRIESGRRAGVKVGSAIESPKVEPSALPEETLESKEVAPAAVDAPIAILTPTQVRHKYSGWLVACAVFSAIASVLSGIILIAKWEWDRNRDGIPDDQQTAIATAPHHQLAPKLTPEQWNSMQHYFAQGQQRPVVPMSPPPAALPAAKDNSQPKN